MSQSYTGFVGACLYAMCVAVRSVSSILLCHFRPYFFEIVSLYLDLGKQPVSTSDPPVSAPHSMGVTGMCDHSHLFI